MKTKQSNTTRAQVPIAAFTAKVFHDYDGKTHFFKYSSISDLMTQIFWYLNENYHQFSIMADYGDVTVTLLPEVKFIWSDTIAHYCFAEGRITEEEAFERMISPKVKEAAV